MALVDQIKSELKEAMKAKEEVKLGVLRGFISAFTNELVATGKTPQDEVTDEIVMTIIKRQSKQRKDSIEQFKKGGREDLAEKEEAELKIIESYLPQMMSKDEILKIAEAKKTEMCIDDKAKMGMLMGALMKDLKDKADGGDVKEVVEGLF
ncbi:GatB/YqeY domain-containing protein [Candidatus Nomurabacteria bacterium]|nr:GatB/YqeY domain-containing protein [Candidatus Nomurabacteria bacterium]